MSEVRNLQAREQMSEHGAVPQLPTDFIRKATAILSTAISSGLFNDALSKDKVR
jgi:hypothetical protein